MERCAARKTPLCGQQQGFGCCKPALVCTLLASKNYSYYRQPLLPGFVIIVGNGARGHVTIAEDFKWPIIARREASEV